MPFDLGASPTIRDVAAGLRCGAMTAVEVMQACLAMQKALAKRLNAFASRLDDDRLLEEARAVDRLLSRGGVAGPLAGIPVALKDIYATADLPTTASSKVLQGNQTAFDSAVAMNLRQAGAIIVGKTQTHEFAYGPTTVNEYAGPSRNPWDADRMPGGSSGGSAIAVATGMCLGATGSDTGGSIRTPSGMCGVSGLKPSYGLVSRYGILPLSWTLDHAGPIARGVDDLAFMLHAMAGHDLRDSGSVLVAIPDYPARIFETPNRLRVGVPKEHFFDFIDQEVSQAFDLALETLGSLGWSIEEVSIPHLRYALGAELAVISAEASAYHRRRMATEAQHYSSDVRSELDAGMVLTAADYLLGQRVRRRIFEEFDAILEKVDLLATPTLPITALPLDQKDVTISGRTMSALNAIWRNVFPTNLTGHPTLSVPCGFSTAGLPVGLQLIGGMFKEVTVLQAGHAYQQVTDWHRRLPPDVEAALRDMSGPRPS